MLTKKLDILFEFFLYLLAYGITFSNALVEISLGFVIFLFILKMAISRKWLIRRSWISLLICVLAGVIVVSFLRSEYHKVSFKGVLRIAKYALLYFAVVDFMGGAPERKKRFFWAIVVVSGFTFLNGIFQCVFGFDMLRHYGFEPSDSLKRIKASFVHPNDFAGYIISVLPFSFAFLSAGIKKWQKVVLVIILLLGFYCLARTSSRGAWIGFGVGLSIYLLFYKKRLLLILPVLVSLFALLSPQGFYRIASLFNSGQNTVWERMELWKGAWSMVKVHPILGFGVNTYSKYFPLYKPETYFNLSYTHNSYLQMWTEIGILGLAVFLGIVGIIMVRSFRDLRIRVKSGVMGIILLGALSGYSAFLVQAGLDTNLFSLVLVTQFWMMSAYLTSLGEPFKK